VLGILEFTEDAHGSITRHEPNLCQCIFKPNFFGLLSISHVGHIIPTSTSLALSQRKGNLIRYLVFCGILDITNPPDTLGTQYANFTRSSASLTSEAATNWLPIVCPACNARSVTTLLSLEVIVVVMIVAAISSGILDRLNTDVYDGSTTSAICIWDTGSGARRLPLHTLPSWLGAQTRLIQP
jgi:hypothetical protein